MKLTLTKTALFLTVMAIAFASCEKKSDYTFEYKVKSGENYAYNASVKSTSSVNFMAQSMEIKADVDMGMHFTIGNVEENSFSTEMIIDAMKSEMSMTMPGQAPQTMIMDSNTEATDLASGDMGVVYKAITGVPLEIVLSNKGKAESFSGFDKMLDAIMTILPEDVTEEAKAQARMSFEQQFNEKMIQGMLDQTVAQFPEKSIAIEESWEANMSLSVMEMKMDLLIKYTLKSVEDNIASLNIEGTITTPAEGCYMNMSGMNIEVNMGGSLEGTTTIDLNNGWYKEMNMTQELTGTMNLMGQELPMEVKSEVKVTQK